MTVSIRLNEDYIKLMKMIKKEMIEREHIKIKREPSTTEIIKTALLFAAKYIGINISFVGM